MTYSVQRVNQASVSVPKSACDGQRGGGGGGRGEGEGGGG